MADASGHTTLAPGCSSLSNISSSVTETALGFWIFMSFQFHSLLSCKAVKIPQGKEQRAHTPSSGL